MQEMIRSKFNFSPKFIVLFIVFLDILGMGLIIPIMPYYVKSFNAPDIMVSALFLSFSVFAFFSAPILGSMSDKYGRRPVLLASLISTTLGWVIFSFSKTIPGLFLGRIIDGLAAGNISTAQNYMIDIAKDKDEQTKNLGLIGAIFGAGFIIGPLIGGTLSSVNIKFPFFLISGLSLVSTILAYFFLPETNHKSEKEATSINPFKSIINVFQDKKVAPLYFAWLLFGVAIYLNQSIFALYISSIFDWGVVASGFLMVLVGLIIVFNQTFLIHKFWLKYFKESYLVTWMLVPFAIGHFIMAIPFKWLFLSGLAITAFCHTTLRVVINSQIVGFYKKEEQGAVVGILTSLMSLAMILGPIFGGSLYEIGRGLPFIATGLVLVLLFVSVSKIYKNLGIREHTHTSGETRL